MWVIVIFQIQSAQSVRGKGHIPSSVRSKGHGGGGEGKVRDAGKPQPVCRGYGEGVWGGGGPGVRYNKAGEFGVSARLGNLPYSLLWKESLFCGALFTDLKKRTSGSFGK